MKHILIKVADTDYASWVRSKGKRTWRSIIELGLSVEQSHSNKLPTFKDVQAMIDESITDYDSKLRSSH